jgi:hypothetical protein
MLSRALAVVVAVLGIAVVARMALGTEVGFRSPMNVESGFGLVVVIGLAIGARDGGEAGRGGLSRRDALLLATIPALVAVFFWRSAGFGFLSDDFVLLKLAGSFAGHYRDVFTQGGGDGFFRPLTYVSLAWTAPWAGTNPVAWHWAGLALHMASSAMVLVLARWLGFSRGAAWFAAALFAVHGSRPEAVVWMAGRFDLVAGLLALVSLAGFVRAWEVGGWKWWTIAMGAAAGAMLSKESAYALPLMVGVFVVAREASWSRRIRFVAPVTMLAVVMFAYRWTRVGGIGGYLTAEGRPQAMAVSLVLIGKALGLRLWAVLFFPVDWDWPVGAWVAVAAVVYVAAWVVVLWSARPGPRLDRGLVWMGLGFTLAAALPPVQQLLIGADLEKTRLLYLPSAGFCLLVAAAVEGAGAKVRVAAMGAMLVFHAVALEHNLGAWEYAAGKAERVCEAVSRCSNLPSGVPRTLRGVYFFANGLPECAGMRRGEGPVQACSLKWDAEGEELK